MSPLDFVLAAVMLWIFKGMLMTAGLGVASLWGMLLFAHLSGQYAKQSWIMTTPGIDARLVGIVRQLVQWIDDSALMQMVRMSVHHEFSSVPPPPPPPPDPYGWGLVSYVTAWLPEATLFAQYRLHDGFFFPGVPG